MIRAAVVGCGDVSVVHLQAIDALADAVLVGVCDTDPAAREAAAARYGVPAFADHRQLLAGAQPDVVHISTPHHQHADVAVSCLEAGVAVILEKPLAHTLADARRILIAAEQHPTTKIGVCYQNRYNATVQAMHALVTSGDLGAVTGASATLLWHRTPAYYQAKPWRGRADQSGGGVLINQAIHTLDLVQWLLGEVTAVAGSAVPTAWAAWSTSRTPLSWSWTTRAERAASSSPQWPTLSIRLSPSTWWPRTRPCTCAATSR